MEPLKQWICDECGDIINKADEGYLEWTHDENDLRYRFRIVHHKLYSPNGPEGSCYYNNGDYHPRLDLELSRFVGTGGIIKMLSFIDVGQYHKPEYGGHRVKDLREWVEIFRRMQLPYYEEARFFWTDAEGNGEFDGINEMLIYSPDTLKDIVEEYGK